MPAPDQKEAAFLGQSGQLSAFSVRLDGTTAVRCR
jgi:hypothetical protein